MRSEEETARRVGAEPAPARWACRYLPLGLVMLAAGCSSPADTDHAEVSGRVLFKGEPLPGGRVTFVSVVGGFANAATIDENGYYKIKAPIGDVQISVDNRMLHPQYSHAPAQSEGMKKKSGAAQVLIQGHFVTIPSKYYHTDQSGLTYKVVSGAQTHDIPLPE
jgi:hypothetical protein